MLFASPPAVLAQTPEHIKVPEKEPHNQTNVLQDSLEQNLSTRDTVQSRFIQSVKESAKKSKFVDLLTSSLFRGPVESNTPSTEDFSAYDGKIVRNLTINGLDPYEDNYLFPEKSYNSGLTRLANTLHIKTHGFVLRRNLLFHKGDKVDNKLLLYNLAYLRDQRYIYDAHLLIDSVGCDSVDVRFIVRDVWSIGVEVPDISPTNTTVELYDRNIAGFGVELRGGIIYRSTNGRSGLGFSLFQRIDNIRGSFIASRIEWIHTIDKMSFQVSLNRAILPQIKYVGGASYSLTDQGYYFLTNDTTTRVRLENIGLWGGRLFNLSSNKGTSDRLAILARISQRSLLSNLPDQYAALNYYPYENNKLAIGSISLYRQNYYTDRLIYGFGSHENVPYGYNATVQLGYEDHIYYNRWYTSVALSGGKQFPWGYGYAGIGISSFFHNKTPEDGMLSIDISYFSPLFPIGQQALRQFLYCSYLKGFNRGVGEGNFLRYADDIRFDLDRNNPEFCGTNRFTLSSETDLFSTVRILGFRFVFFSFFDATWIGSNSFAFKNEFLPGLGGGIRIRNDKLVFQTLQIRFGWYPKFPQNGFNGYIDISGVDRFLSKDFIPTVPAIVEFK